jgi:hypothetical protein
MGYGPSLSSSQHSKKRSGCPGEVQSMQTISPFHSLEPLRCLPVLAFTHQFCGTSTLAPTSESNKILRAVTMPRTPFPMWQVAMLLVNLFSATRLLALECCEEGFAQNASWEQLGPVQAGRGALSSSTKAGQDQLRPSGTDRVAKPSFPDRRGPAQTEWRSPLSQAGRVGLLADQDQGRPSDQDPPCADHDLPDQDQLRPSGTEPYSRGRPGRVAEPSFLGFTRSAITGGCT